MPVQVVVVRRSRRSLFAVPRALPAWLRSLWAAFALEPAGRKHAELESHEAAPETSDAARLPRLKRDAHGAHRCIGCELCVRVCPSACLVVEGEAQGKDDAGAPTVERFELEAGACIGCRLCVTACPVDALEMARAPAAAIARVSGRPVRSDLLEPGPGPFAPLRPGAPGDARAESTRHA